VCPLFGFVVCVGVVFVGCGLLFAGCLVVVVLDEGEGTLGFDGIAADEFVEFSVGQFVLS